MVNLTQGSSLVTSYSVFSWLCSRVGTGFHLLSLDSVNGLEFKLKMSANESFSDQRESLTPSCIVETVIQYLEITTHTVHNFFDFIPKSADKT